MPNLLDIDNFCEDLPEIKTDKLLLKGVFHPEGLFSEQVFGPLKNYTCQCKIYHGVTPEGTRCKQCDVEITNNIKRRRQFAKISLPIPVINPVYYSLLLKVLGGGAKKLYSPLLKEATSFLYLTSHDFIISHDPDLKEVEGNRVLAKYEKLEAIFKLTELLLSENEVDSQYKYLTENIDKLFIRNVVVLPPELRPASIYNIRMNERAVDQINKFYNQIMIKSSAIRNSEIDVSKDKKLFYYFWNQLQKSVVELYNHILEKLAKKEGLIRGNILGKRIDFSGRAVIVPDPELKLDECSIPYAMFLELFKPKIIQKLIEIGRYKTVNSALEVIDDCIRTKNPFLFKVCLHLSEDEYCILNRQPSLHKFGFLAFKIKIANKMTSLGDVIRIHPLVCDGYNADFDGDQMSVHIPIGDDAKEEIREKFLSTKNLFNVSDTSIVPRPSQDIILGIYILTSNKLENDEPDKEYKGIILNPGLYEFNNILPKDFRVIDYVVTNKELISILNELIHNYPTETAVKVLDDIKLTGINVATLFGPTLSLDSFIIENSEDMRKYLYEPESLFEQMKRSSQDHIRDYLKENFKAAYFVESGARGNWDQVKQIALTRGFISNSKGEIIESPIKGSLIKGLSEKEFFYSTYGERKGLLDVALNTGTSGYLSRKLIFTCINQELDKDLIDCGTKDTLEMYVDSDIKAESLIYRNYVDENDNIQNITRENYKEIIGKKIKLRSPIFCESEKICLTCYGNLYNYLNSKYVGVLAAQTLGEVGTQLTLRTFHLSGSANLKGDSDGNIDLKQVDIISDLKRAAEALHSFKDKTYKDILKELYLVYSDNKPIHHIHFECVVSQLMWYGNTKWRLIKDRHNREITYKSVMSVPKSESFLLSLAFSSPKQSIINGILSKKRYFGIIDKLLLGEKIE